MFADAAEVRKHLVRRLFADMAGVQDDHVRAFRLFDRGIAQRRQHIGHAAAVIDVHLAAPGLDKQFFLFAGHCFTILV
jgi:hypothetical protein